MNQQASSRHCFVCGVKNESGLRLTFFDQEPGIVIANFTVCESHQGYPGVVHGGVIAAILDEVAGRTFMTGDPPRFMVTAKLSVRYRRPVPVGKPLKAIGKAIEDNGKIASAQGQIVDADGSILADAEVVLAQIPPRLADTMKVGPDDWRVYPEGEVDR